jgi:hypothetical protein
MPEAVAAARAVEQFGHAYGQWQAVAAEIVGLLRLAGGDTSLPAFPERLASLVRDARRADGVQVPPPIPGGTAALPLEMVEHAA